MTITSLSYLVLVLIVWLVALPLRSARSRQILFLAASYLFYASWGGGFLAILIASSVLNYFLGILLRKRPTLGRLWVGISLNVLLLVVFKYLPAAFLGTTADATTFGLLRTLAVPVGISFWTFQALSYLFDLYRDEEVDPTLVEFLLYMSFWPTVLAGPVCRLPEMLTQFRQVPPVRWDDISEGSRRILIGLFMKLVLVELLANGFTAGEGVAAGFDQISRGWGGLDVWLLAFGYGFQLFFDFAGYSHIVIGSALLFGIRLQENFDRPYLSTTPSEFWTRWHMSLSFWIRDYVFMPLATVRRALWWRYAALVFAMMLFGLWHGATVLFVLWGAYHGLLLVAHRSLQNLRRRWKFDPPDSALTVFSWATTFALVSLGWIFFRGHDLHQVITMLGAVFSPSTYRQLALRPNFYILTSLIIVGYFVYHLIERALVGFMENPWLRRFFWLLSPLRYALVALLTIAWSRHEAAFVYFQF